MSNAYTTVDAVIIDTCHKLGDMALRKYATLNAHATSWFMFHYNAESGQTLKTVLLDVGPDRVCNLPDDYLDFVVVGRQFGDRIRNLAHNPRLSPLPPVEPFLDRIPLSEFVDTSWPNYTYAGFDGGALQGYGWGEYREEFTIDPIERTLRLSTIIEVDKPLFFQYVSADLCPHKATPLHPYYALALQYWVLWQMHLLKNEAGPAANYEKLYYQYFRRAQAKLSPFSYAALEDILRASYNLIR